VTPRVATRFMETYHDREDGFPLSADAALVERLTPEMTLRAAAARAGRMGEAG
jgi:hypothetical protein